MYRANIKGYGLAGASLTKKALKGFRVESGSPREDIDWHNSTLRQRARILYMSSSVAASAIKTNRTNVIGVGLKLNPKVDRDFLGLTAQQAEEWERKTRAEFNLWAEKKESCDATGVNNFYAMQQLALVSYLMSGDVFALIKREPITKNKPYSLRLQLIEADRCSTPANGFFINLTEAKAKNGNDIFDGVEVDKNGKIVAYYFRNTYPYQLTAEKAEWKRVEAYGKNTELPNVLHLMNAERPGQYRGVTYLSQIIEPILQIRRYTEAEITSAIIENLFTAFVTSSNTEENPLGSASEEEQEENEYNMVPGQVTMLKNGESITFGDPKRPSSGFDLFVKALCTQIGAALEIPRDLLMKEFNASYSASRAALLEAWKSFKMYREWFMDDFCKPTYEIWLSEAVARGRIYAPGFFEDAFIRKAWLEAEWIGPSQGQLDPVKEITAEIMAVSEGFSTHEDSTIRLNGGNWKSNISQLERELERKHVLEKEKQTQNVIQNMIKETVKNSLEEGRQETENG